MGNTKSVVRDIELMLNNSLCEDAGIIPLSIEEGLIEIGAMNPEYIRVKEVISELKRRFNVEVVLKQITSSEWEEWMENNPLNSIKSCLLEKYCSLSNKFMQLFILLFEI